MISKDKTYRTECGYEVRIYATDAGGLFPVHGAIFYDGVWSGMEWTEEGKTYVTTDFCKFNTAYDLAEVKPRIKRTVWINVYEGGGVFAVSDPINKGENCIACIKVDLDFEEGEGL